MVYRAVETQLVDQSTARRSMTLSAGTFSTGGVQPLTAAWGGDSELALYKLLTRACLELGAASSCQAVRTMYALV